MHTHHLVLALTFLLGAAAHGELAGYYTGQIENGTAITPVQIRIEESGGEHTIGFPQSGIREALLDDVKLSDDRVAFTFLYRRVDYVFEGALKGESLAGTVQFDEASMPFSAARTAWDPPYTTEDLSYANGDVSIRSTLYMPKGPGPHPALVMMHGSGDNERGRYGFWGDFFARHGVALLASDKRGCGESTGDWNEVGFEALARDGIEGVKLLQARDDIDAGRVGMTGISQAGWVMVQAAALSDDIAFLLIDSGATYDVEREGYFDYEAALANAGHSKDDIDVAVSILRMDNQVTRSGEGYEELRAEWRALREQPWFRDFRFFPLPADAKFRNFYRLILDFDPYPLLEQINLPITWLYGEDDTSVSAAESIAILEQLQRQQDKVYTIHRFPRADHGLRVPSDPTKHALPFPVYADGYLEAKEAFIKNRIQTAQ